MLTPLWQPSRARIARAHLTAFMRAVHTRWQVKVADYEALYRFSLDEPEKFWLSMWDFGQVRAATRGRVVVRDAGRMPGARFFPDARLNFAENLLRRRGSEDAIVFRGENGMQRRLSHAALYDEVSRVAQALADLGVRPGDRVAGYLPNLPETVVAAIAAASLGAVWSSCSPDFGVSGVLDRFGQIEPKVLISADGHFYNGKTYDSLERLSAILEELPSVDRAVIVRHVRDQPSGRDVRRAVSWDAWLADYAPREIVFEQFPFNHPLYILFSSGTTGPPKCIVHGTGGTLLQHVKEHQLHCDIHPGDRVFYFTTCGWMMWNWLVSALASEATLLLYDGSPLYPNGHTLFDFADASEMTLFGTAAKYLDSIRKAGLVPGETHPLATLSTMTSTGSPLAPESFDFVYEKIKRDIHLASISGGTDIIGCFVSGNPIGPVWRGEIQVRALGMAVQVFDEQGRPITGEKGELVCTAPFPSMPLGFWNDPGDRKYRAAYFEKFPNVWCHGDYAEVTEHDGVIIYGRSDAVLNPGGVRIGTAEIYRQVEQFDEVVECVVVGQKWDQDERVILFVQLRDGQKLDQTLIEAIKTRIRTNTTPRHVPTKIIQVADIPHTKSGKLVELAVREVIHGQPVRNQDALANPEALELFRNLPELER